MKIEVIFVVTTCRYNHLPNFRSTVPASSRSSSPQRLWVSKWREHPTRHESSSGHCTFWLLFKVLKEGSWKHTHTHFVVSSCRYYKSKKHSEYVQPTRNTRGKSSKTTLLPVPIFVILVITIISVASAPKFQIWWRYEMLILRKYRRWRTRTFIIHL